MKKKKFNIQKLKSIISFLFVCALLLSLIAICFAIKREKQSSFQVVGASAEGEYLSDNRRFFYKLNVLNPSTTWDFTEAENLGFSFIESEDIKGFFKMTIPANWAGSVRIGSYSLPTDSTDIRDLRPALSCVPVSTSLPYQFVWRSLQMDNGTYPVKTSLTTGLYTQLPFTYTNWTDCYFEILVSTASPVVREVDFFPSIRWSSGYASPYFDFDFIYNSGFEEGKTEGFEEGKTEGFEEGKTEGFEEGKTEGLQESKKGIWNNLSGYSVELYDFELSSNVSLPDSIVLNELDLISVSNLIEGSTVNLNRLTPLINNYFQSNYNLHVEDFDNLKVDISFLFSPNVNLNDVAIIGDGNSENFYNDVSFITSDNRSFLGSWQSYDGNKVLVNPTDYTSPLLQKLTFEFAGNFGVNLLNVYLSDGNKNWIDGFNAGKSESNSISYYDGFKEGEIIGYKDGYNKGLIQGSTDPYGLENFMFSYLDMPGRIIYNFLNFDFLGYNVASLFALLITALIVAYVWKKVT